LHIPPQAADAPIDQVNRRDTHRTCSPALMAQAIMKQWGCFIIAYSSLCASLCYAIAKHSEAFIYMGLNHIYAKIYTQIINA